MIALNMPMQPSSNTPMMAFSRCSCAASASPSFASFPPTFTSLNGMTCSVLCLHAPVDSHLLSFDVKYPSVKSSLQSVEYSTPALVSEPLRLSMPTSPGQVPDQFATV